MIRLLRTDSTNPDFVALVRLLDADLLLRDGADNAFYSQFNKIDAIRYVILAYFDEKPVGCGAFKILGDNVVEVKRMFTHPNARGKGVAKMVLQGLEDWAVEEGYQFARLETGTRQPEAIALYDNAGYARIPNYGQYEGIENSLCFEKKLTP
jgi:putative acetyltransferase